MPKKRKKSFRSQQWFNNPKNPDMTALYLERYLKKILEKNTEKTE